MQNSDQNQTYNQQDVGKSKNEQELVAGIEQGDSERTAEDLTSDY